jgi:thioredoxin reductase (NADPH)
VDDQEPVPIEVALDRMGAGAAAAAEFAGAFPVFDDGQVAKLRPYGEEAQVEAQHVFFREGDADPDLILVLEGEVQAVAHYGAGAEPVYYRFHPGQFVGVMSLLTGEGAYVTTTTTMPSRVVAIPMERLRSAVGEDVAISEALLRAFLLRHSLLMRLGTGPKVIGSRYSPDLRRILEFLARNRLTATWIDVESDPRAESLLRSFGFTVADTPLVLIAGQPILKNPSVTDLARVFGVRQPRDHSDKECDLVVIGAGPAGLAAAVYGGSEGLVTMMVEAVAIGGQAGTSSRIENYLGFPAGLSGEELATRAALQAEKFSAGILLGAQARGLNWDGAVHVIELGDGRRLLSRAVVIATGARYRRLPAQRLMDFEGSGVYYAATEAEAQRCTRAVAVVGGGNSAGQAAIFLAKKGFDVHHIVRATSLEASMSRYLIDQIEKESRIALHYGSSVLALEGDGELSAITVNVAGGNPVELEVSGLFSFIGAEPNTDWVGDALEKDKNGFILTGSDFRQKEHGWSPLLLETSRPGVFCAGDARHGSANRVATAVGEGAMAVRLVHQRLASPVVLSPQPA